MISVIRKELADEIENSLKKGLVLLTGAGISNILPAGLPLAREVNREIFELLFTWAKLSHLSPVLETRVMHEIQGVPMEHIWEQLTRVVGVSVLEVLNIFDTTKPTRDHFLIAQLYKGNNAPFLLTLNFDPLHEISIEIIFGKRTNFLSEDEHYRHYRKQLADGVEITTGPLVAHLHGSIRSSPNALVSTIGSIGLGLSRQKEQVLSLLLERYDLFCVGYSDSDSDVLPIISESPNKVYWYLFGGELPRKITSLKDRINARFIQISRGVDERGLSDTLLKLPLKQRRHLASSLEPYQYDEDKAVQHRMITKKLRGLSSQLINKFSPNESMRVAQSRLVLAALCDDIGKRELAYEILGNQQTTQDRSFNFAYSQRMGHLLERRGNVRKALEFYMGARINSIDDANNALSRITISSARLGLWKRGPWRIFDLAGWGFERVKLSRSDHQFARRRAQWELGDFFQHLGEYFLFPSAALIYIFGHIPAMVIAFVGLLDRVSMGVFGWLRKFLLRRSAIQYSLMARDGLKSINDGAPDITAMGLLRLSEVLAALGRINLAKYILNHLASRGGRLFEWSQSEHGVANGTCARGIIDFYAGNYELARQLLSQAKAEYGTHDAGKIKTDVYLFRTERW